MLLRSSSHSPRSMVVIVRVVRFCSHSYRGYSPRFSSLHVCRLDGLLEIATLYRCTAWCRRAALLVS